MLAFTYHGSRTPDLNPVWLQALTYNADSTRGLYVCLEPDIHLPREATRTGPMVFGEVLSRL